MLESGIGRLANVHLQTLPGFTLPGDTSASARYFEEDLIEPGVMVDERGRHQAANEVARDVAGDIRRKGAGGIPGAAMFGQIGQREREGR